MGTRPRPVNAMLVIAVAQVAIALCFAVGFTVFKPNSELLTGIYMTASAYAVVAVPLIVGILRRNAMLVRVLLVANIVISLPLKAAIGIVLSAISLALSFRATAAAYFGHRRLAAQTLS